ncbi:hypothetical protein J7L02_01400, partial [Candidatus Woesearchaeota archaeon]|nr:hypothetical protein [Candidatus Woesearchaeota archaeon]
RVFGDKNSKGKELVKTEKPEALLLDIEKEIIARGIAVDKVEGAYKVMASEDLHGVVKIWKGPSHEGDVLAKTEHPWEQLLLDIEKGVLAIGSDVIKSKGVYKVVAPKSGAGQGIIMSWEGPNSECEELAKTRTLGEELVLDIDNNIEIHGAFIHIFENGEYLVHSKLSSQQEMPITVRIGDKTILENSAGTYKIFNQSGVWRINRTDEEDFQAVVDLDNAVNVSGFEVEVLDKGVYKVTSSSETLVNVKTFDGKTILENAEGTYKIFKKGDSWVVEKLKDED